MKRGQDFSTNVQGSLGGVLDFHGESMILRNVTNLDAIARRVWICYTR